MRRGIVTNATDWRSHKLQGRCTFQGLPISIENERGSYRQGTDQHGRFWRTFMHYPYGYVRASEGTDGDHVDVYLGPHKNCQKVFIVHQQDPDTKRYDEDKVMLGFTTPREAKSAYLRQYDRPGFFQSMETVDMPRFKEMLKEKKGMKLKKANDDDGYTSGYDGGNDEDDDDDEEMSDWEKDFEREHRNEEAKDNRMKKSLIPVRRMITRGGKTFMTTVYVASTKKEAKEQASKHEIQTGVVSPTERRPAVRSTVELMQMQQNSLDFAPNDNLAVDKILAFQRTYFAGKPKPSVYDMVTAATEEVKWALAQGDSGKDWYKKSMKKTRNILITKYPDLGGDTEWDFFLSILAVMSPSQSPLPNLRSAVIAYDGYRKTGSLPELNPETGKAYSITSTKLVKGFNDVLSKFATKEDFVQFMNGVGEVGDLNTRFGSAISGRKDEAAFNSMIFGEKVGMFYQSMRGTEGAVAVDRWAIRSYYRWSGELSETTGSGEKAGDRRRVINTKMSVKERRNVEYVIQTVATNLNLKPSQVQAVMWYYEKRLYEKLGWGKGTETVDFAGAAERLYMEKSLDYSEYRSEIKNLFDTGKMPTFDQVVAAVMKIRRENEIEKAVKYIRRWRDRNGKWRYQYRETTGREHVAQNESDPTQQTLPGMSDKEWAELEKHYRRRAPGDGREKTIERPEHLNAILTRTTFCLMSAGRNPEDPEDMKLSDKQIAQRYDTLLDDLRAKGYVFTRCRGKYVNPEESVMVMCHDADRSDMLELGAKYKQDSVVFSEHGNGSLIYTTGPKVGQEDSAGKGYTLVPDATDFYTKMPLGDGKTIKFTVNLEEIIKAMIELIKASRKGLVPVRKQVTRGGKTFMQTVWVKPSEAKTERQAQQQAKPQKEDEEGPKQLNLIDPVEWAKKHDEPDVTENKIVARIAEKNPDVYTAVEEAEEKLKHVTQTVEKFRKSGEGASSVYEAGRAKRHERILRQLVPPEAMAYARPSRGERPTITMLGGRGGSGKSWFKGKVYDPNKAVVLDADEIKKMLPEYKGWNAFEVHEESSDILEKALAICKAYRLNVVIDATMKTSKSALARVKEFAQEGYDIEAHYMFCPRQISAERAVRRYVGPPRGRYVPVNIVLQNTKNEYTFKEVRKFATKWSFRDSEGPPPPKLLAEGSGRAKSPMLKSLPTEDQEWSPYDFYDFRMPSKPSAQTQELIDSFSIEKSKYSSKYFRNGRWHYRYPTHGARRPRSMGEHEVLGNLGGTTGGALHIRLPNGEEKVAKRSTSANHLRDEYMANRIYRALGVPVPKVELFRDNEGELVQVADYIKGTPLGDLYGAEREQAERSLREGFVADALVGNWDVIGMDADNVLWDGSKAWRIDNGGALRYRAQGAPKGDKFGNEVGEIDTMRNPTRGAGRVFAGISSEEIAAQATDVVSKGRAILAGIDDPQLRRTMEARINDLAQRFNVSKASRIPDMALIKSDSGKWYLNDNGKLIPFVWLREPLEKAVVKTKSYYSPEEVKARGMRWVTIRGARVLLQGTSDGGYVVVGGAGGKLNNLKVDNILTREEYSQKRKAYEKKRKEDTQPLTKEEIAEARAIRKEQVKQRKQVRAEYTAHVAQTLGVSEDEIRSKITAEDMKALEDKARKMVEARSATKTMDQAAIDAEVEKQAGKEVDKAVQKQVKNIERAALETLANDVIPSDPNRQDTLTKLLDKDKALEILAARKQFRKKIKAIGEQSADIPSDLKVGAIFAGVTTSEMDEIQNEVKQQIETQKNIQLYDMLNAQSQSIKKYVDQGAVSAINGLIGDVYGVGATFTADAVKELGIEGIARATAIKLQMDGKAGAVQKALEAYSSTEREKVVDRALSETKKRLANADELRNMARDTGDAEAILSMASANGHALKQITAAQRALGTAVGSLRAAAHLINALDDPPGDTIQIDMGRDLSRARDRAHAAGLKKGDYRIRTAMRGRGKRLVLEIKKDKVNTFFQNQVESVKERDRITEIKQHKANTGYLPPGIKNNIKLDPAQEAGLRFFREKGRVLLDFEAGLGKTAVAYAGIAEAMNNGGAKKVLVVVPAKLSGAEGDFAQQGKTFLTPEMQKLIHSSGKRSRRRDYHGREGPIINIISQDQLREDKSVLKEAGYDMVVVDEIHEMTAGSGNSGRYRALAELDEVPRKIAMSGTNIKSSKKELYRKIQFLDPHHTLGSMAEFEKRYKGLNQGTGMFQDAANDAFRKEVGEYVYTQKNHLPVKNTNHTIRVPLTPEQRHAYAESERQYRKDRDNHVPGASGQRDSRNYAIISNSDADKNAKLDKMVEVMKKDHPGEKAVIHVSRPGAPVLTAMRTATKRLEEEFGKGTVAQIHGETDPKELSDIKRRFNDPDDPLRFIVGTKSLESGHNLQHGGTVTFHLDVPDSAAALDQRTARVFRKGQDKDTSSYVLSGLNPMDMRYEDLMDTKRKEMNILGNPREVSAMDDDGFIGMLDKYEQEAGIGT